jgi:hypothetical protein
MLTGDKDGFITGGAPVEGVKRTRTDNLLFDIRGDVRAIRSAVQGARVEAVRRAGAVPVMAGRGRRAPGAQVAAVPRAGIRGDTGSRSSAASRAMPAAIPTGAAVASKIVSRRPHKSAEAPVAAGARDTKGRFVSRASSVGVGGRSRAGEGDGVDGRLSSVVDRLSQAVGGLEDVGEADPAVRAMQEIADPISRAYGALRGDKDARRQDGWFKKILKRLKGIEDKSSEPVVVEQGGVFALLGRFIPMLLPVLGGLAATAAALAAYFKIEGFVSDGEKAKEGAEAIKKNVAEPAKETLKAVGVDTDKRAAEERARVLESRDGEYAKEEALKKRFVSPTGAAQGSKQWNDEFYRFSQDELAKQEAEAKKGMVERATDTARSGAKAVAGKVRAGWDSVKGFIGRAAERAGTDPGLVAQIAHFESGFNPDAAPIHKNPAKNRVRLFDGRMGMSSAHGLGQFTDATWLDTLRKHGGKHGVANASKLTADQAAKLRSDVELQAAMLAELTRENADRGRALGGKNDAANVYALHNLGEGDGAKFLKSLSANPGMSVRDALMRGVTTEKGRKRVESVIANNRSLYGDGSISVGDAYTAMGKKMSAGARYAQEARSVSARSPVGVSIPAPAVGSLPSVPSIPDAPRVAVPLGSSAASKPAVVVLDRGDVGRDVSDRGIAHVATGGLARGRW